MAHLGGIELHLAVQSSQRGHCLDQSDALIETRVHRQEDQKRIEGLGATFRAFHDTGPATPLSPVSVQLAVLVAAVPSRPARPGAHPVHSPYL